MTEFFIQRSSFALTKNKTKTPETIHKQKPYSTWRQISKYCKAPRLHYVKILVQYFDTGDVGWIEILSAKTHRNQDEDRFPVLRERPFAQLPHILQVD